MKIEILPCLFDNYSYLIICEETRDAALVDPAEYYPVVQAIDGRNIQLKSIFCTHHHADHIGGVEELQAVFPGLSIYGHESDSRRIPGLNRPLKDNSEVQVGNIRGQVLHTPGHTSGSLCYLFEEAIFTGDTMFGAGCGRLFEGSPKQMYQALNNRIKILPASTRVYFGHEYTRQNLKFAEFVEPGNQAVGRRLQQTLELKENAENGGEGLLTSPSTLELECETNPFLRCEEHGIIDSVLEKIIGDKPDPLTVFTALRRLKDSF